MAPRTLLCCLASLTVVLALAGCGGEEEAGSVPDEPEPTAQLTIRVDPDGDGPEKAKQSRISCDPETNDRVCAAAGELRPADFEPTPDDVACTELFGGPETASISGTFQREQVDARFSRQDGCEIARWEKVAPLLAEAGR